MTGAATSPRLDVPVERLAVSAYTVPTETPESDGTLEWDETTIVVVEIESDGVAGLGFSHTGQEAAGVIERLLAPVVVGRAAMDIPAVRSSMVAAVRNLGLPELAARAISAVEIARNWSAGWRMGTTR